jgi:hypothetical protein
MSGPPAAAAEAWMAGAAAWVCSVAGALGVLDGVLLAWAYPWEWVTAGTTR